MSSSNKVAIVLSLAPPLLLQQKVKRVCGDHLLIIKNQVFFKCHKNHSFQ